MYIFLLQVFKSDITCRVSLESQVPPTEMPNKSIYDLLCEGNNCDFIIVVFYSQMSSTLGIAVNSKALVNALEDHTFEFIGNKTECALLVFSNNLGYDYRTIREANKALQM